MKSCLTRFSIAFLVTLVFYQFALSQVYIWGGPGDVNSEFAYGLNDWTTSGGDTTIWVWDFNAMPDEATYYGIVDGPLPSASAYNGVALYNSDRFHSIEGFDYPHRGELTSPSFSTEGHNTVVVRFDQMIRFWNPDNVSLLQVSIDDGNTWLPEEGIEINPDLTGKWNKRVDSSQMIKLIDITEWAVDEPNVQIRFVWDGAYYYWMIDDVSVIEKPEVELGILSTIYDPIAAQIPRDQADARSSSFGLDVFHFGTKDIEKGVVGVNITDQEGNLLYQDSILDINFVAGETTTILFEDLFVPTTETYKNTGYHYFNYWVKAPGINELNNFDNQSRESYYLTEDRYDCSYDVDASYTSPFGSYGVFSIFHTGKVNWGEEEYWPIFMADSVRLQIADNNDQDDFISDIRVFLYRINDEVSFDFSNFDTLSLAQFSPNEEAHPQMELVGFGFESSYLGIDYDDFKVGLYEIDFSGWVMLKSNSRYMLMAFWEHEDTVYHGVDEDIFYNASPTCGWYYAERDSNGSHWNFDPWYGWRLSLDLAYLCDIGTEGVQLPENTLAIYPNPANDEFNIEINSDSTIKEGSLILTDINNNFITAKKLDDLSIKSEIMNVSDIPSGNYILKLVTKEGVVEKKVVIQH